MVIELLGIQIPYNKKNFFKGAVWIGLIFLLAGGAVMIRAITFGMEDTTTPRWTGIIFGLMFFSAGITVGLLNSDFNDYRETWWLSYLHATALLSIPFIFLMLLNWVAFGPGAREFSMSISTPILFFAFDRANEIIGRIVFGIPALLMDAVLVFMLYQLVANIFRKQKNEENTDMERAAPES